MEMHEGVPSYALAIDILGFRSSLAEKPRRLVTIYRELVHILRTSTALQLSVTVRNIATGVEHPETLGFKKLLAPRIFSDSVFIVTIDDSPDALEEICAIATISFRHFLRAKLPLSGVIAKGEGWYYPQEEILLGSALVKSYEFMQTLDIIGIVLEESMPTAPGTSRALVSCKSGTKTLQIPQATVGNPKIPLAVEVPYWQKIWDRMCVEAQGRPFERKYQQSHEVVRLLMEGGAS